MWYGIKGLFKDFYLFGILIIKTEAIRRIKAPDRKIYSSEEAMKILGVTDKDLVNVEVDFV